MPLPSEYAAAFAESPEPEEQAEQPVNPAKKRGRPPKILKVEPVEEIPDAAMTMADGIKYVLARFWRLFENDPIAIVQVMAAVRMAEKGYRPPNVIEDWRSSARVNWWDAFDEIRASIAKHHVIPETQRIEKGDQGRPTNSDVEWT